MHGVMCICMAQQQTFRVVQFMRRVRTDEPMAVTGLPVATCV